MRFRFKKTFLEMTHTLIEIENFILGSVGALGMPIMRYLSYFFPISKNVMAFKFFLSFKSGPGFFGPGFFGLWDSPDVGFPRWEKTARNLTCIVFNRTNYP